MKITVTANALERDAKLLENASRKMHAQLWVIVRRVALATMKRVKLAMPVDTGRAKASWGVWGGTITLGKRGRKRDRKLRPGAFSAAWNQAAEASPADSIWKQEEAALRVTQGSNLPYIERLNTGHSEQAPRGFLDMAAAQADAALQAEVEKAIEVIWQAAMPSAPAGTN